MTTPLPTTLSRLVEFRDKLTSTAADGVRVVHSSGGAAGGVISEGMGYALLLAGLAMSSERPSSPEWQTALAFGEEIFAGWRRMCELTRESCQEDATARCGSRPRKNAEPLPGFASCLPAWKFDDKLRTQQAAGSATDGDEDALLGMVLMVSSSDADTWPLWRSAAHWAFETARAFLRFNTQARARSRGRLPRLGSCWGGWDCNNPSYLAPAHYRAFRRFMLRLAPRFNAESEAERAADAWGGLVDSSYAMLAQAQCGSTGLTPNWWVPQQKEGSSGWPGCNSSGTPADKFGVEASRGVWRVALDGLWSADADPTRVSGRAYCNRVSLELARALDPSVDAGFGPLSTGCTVRSIQADWYWNPFMFGPLSAALLLPLPSSESAAARANQTAALQTLSRRVADTRVSDYYSGSWVALATATLNGDARRACRLLFDRDECPNP